MSRPTTAQPEPDPDVMIADAEAPLDPLADAESTLARNRAKVGSARPMALLHTFGIGSVMDLPQFSVMPAGLDDWEPIWRRMPNVPVIEEPRLLRAVQVQLGPRVRELRPYPWRPKARTFSQEGDDLGIPSRVFPQWLRCSGCDFLGPLPRFGYTNEHPFRPDLATFEHVSCPGRSGPPGRRRATRRSLAVPARYLLACTDGHLDEFPYGLWVHRGQPCPAAPQPDLKLRDSNVGQGTGAVVSCARCDQRRRMTEAQGDAGREKLPRCRGRHPHLDAFDRACGLPTVLIMMGASNLWFAATQSVIVMPRTEQDNRLALAGLLRGVVPVDRLAKYADQPDFLRDLLDGKVELPDVTDEDLMAAVREALAPPVMDEEWQQRREEWDPVDLLVPEWNYLQRADPLASEWDYLQRPSLFNRQADADRDLMVTAMPTDDRLPASIRRVIAVNRMKKVNAFIGFTRIDDFERIGDESSRLVKLRRDGRPEWVPATEDRGEGVFLQLDEDEVAGWEAHILATPLWEAHRDAHRRNVERRHSETAERIDADRRLRPPRYWLVHTLAHVLIRQMAMYCGYGAASLSERLYAWPATSDRPAAAGLLICTTSSDSDGTLGGLVALSEPDRLAVLVTDSLRRASRCSSDPVCAQRTPRTPEDFLHGAACHCCCFASETSCERANRFLDRRFLLTLPGGDGRQVPGFFGPARAG